MLQATFMQVENEAWAIIGKAVDVKNALVEGNGKTVTFVNARSGKQTTRQVIGTYAGTAVIAAGHVAILVGSQVGKNGMTRGEFFAKCNADRLAAKLAAIDTKPVKPVKPVKPASDSLEAQIAALQAQLAALVAPLVVAVPTVAGVKPRSAAQLANDARLGAAGAARRAAKLTPAVAATVAIAADLPPQSRGDLCVCASGQKASFTHHAASKITDTSVHACRQCVKNVSGKDMVAALHAAS